MKSIDLQIPRHTVILLCGPTMCGKTNLVNTAFNAEDFAGYNIQVLSSDFTRLAILGNPDLHRHSAEMLAVSRQAFDILMTSYRALISYPVNADYVIVDTRGAQEAFRQEIVANARANGYKTMLVKFEYKKREEYYQYCDTAEEKRVVEADVQRYLRKVLPTIYARDWDMSAKITSREQNVRFSPARDNGLPLTQESLTHVYAPGQPVAIIGDSHECVEELQELVDKVKVKHGENTQFVHVGDYLDKGQDTLKMVDKILDLAMSGQHVIIKGNHENYVYRRLKGELEANKELDEQHFTSLSALEGNEEYTNKFKVLFEASLPFLTLKSEGARDVIVTHAPCDTKFLGKFSDDAQRAQRNFYFKDRTAPVKDTLEFIYRQAEFNHPLHVFGHIAHNSESLVYKNKVFLDTGAVHGNKLTAFVIKNNRYEFVSVDCRQRIEKDLPSDLTTIERGPRKFNIHDYDLTPQDHRLVHSVMGNGVRYISGTMPPAPSNDQGLETLEAGLKYFRRKGVQRVAVQPKYMGSRAQFYLHRDPEVKDFAVSRSGWVIRHCEGLEELLAQWNEQVFKEQPQLETIVLDGELLPWKALGAGLIDHQFRPYGTLVGNELYDLSEDTVFRSFKLGQEYDPMARLAELSLYSEALEVYAADTPLEFKPFNILLVNGKVYEGDAWDGFELFNDDEQLLVDINSPEAIAVAKAFYDDITVNQRMEGVVIKPMDNHEHAPPYMKVRNADYLRLVYGYDYQDREGQLIRQKNISGKAAVATREHRYAVEMLTADDDRRQELIVKMIGEIKKEAEIDPRL